MNQCRMNAESILIYILGAEDGRVLYSIYSLYSMYPDDPYQYMHNGEITDLTGFDYSTVKISIERLIEMGLLQKNHLFKNDSDFFCFHFKPALSPKILRKVAIEKFTEKLNSQYKCDVDQAIRIFPEIIMALQNSSNILAIFYDINKNSCNSFISDKKNRGDED